MIVADRVKTAAKKRMKLAMKDPEVLAEALTDPKVLPETFQTLPNGKHLANIEVDKGLIRTNNYG